MTLKGLYRTTQVVPERFRYSPDARRARRLTREHETGPAPWSIAS
ncbi:hypothetical protein ACFQY7_56085 [Actinomadura luteofluorescens]